MKVEWEQVDIIAGRKTGHPRRQERWMIGYIPNTGKNNWTLISLSDGLVDGPRSQLQLAAQLNSMCELPAELLPE